MIYLPGSSFSIQSLFGQRTLNGHSEFHGGVDFAAPAGTVISAMRSLIFVVLVVGGGMLLLVGYAQAKINMLESYPLVCQKGLVALDHDVNSFDKLFGPPILKKSRELTEPRYEGVIATTVTYQNAVTLIYSTANGKNMIHRLTLGSAQAQKIVGFDVQTKKGIRKLYGVPYKKTPNSLVYGCDNVEITFQIKNGQVLSVDIIAHNV